MQRNIIGKLNSEALPIFSFCLSLLITAALANYIIIPNWQKSVKLRIQLTNYRLLISSENGFAQIKNDIEEKNRLLNEKLEKISSSLSNTQDLAGYLELLISKAKVDEIRFTKMQPQAEIKNQDYTLFPVILEMSTTYNSLGRFISAIERLPYYFKIERISMESGQADKLDIKLLITSIIPSRGDL